MRSATARCASREVEVGLGRLDPGLQLHQGIVGGELLLAQGQGLAAPLLGQGHPGPRRPDLRLGLGQGEAVVGWVELQQQLPRLDGPADLRVDAHHLGRDLGGDPAVVGGDHAGQRLAPVGQRDLPQGPHANLHRPVVLGQRGGTKEQTGDQ